MTSGLSDGHVSYHFPTGRYYVQFQGGISIPIAFPAMFEVRTVILATGTTGVGTEADCETCPPPI